MFSKRTMFCAAAAVALAGCNTADRHIGDSDPFMGEAVKYNAAMMTINPDPVYPAGSAQPGDNGDKGAQAVKRYRTDQVNARHKAEASVNSGNLSTTQTSSGNGPR